MDRAISYMKALDESSLDLILKFATPIMKTIPLSGICVFTENYGLTSLDTKHRISAFLESYSQEYQTMYIEFLVFHMNETGQEFYDVLSQRYLTSAKLGGVEQRERFRQFVTRFSNMSSELILKHLPQDGKYIYQCLFSFI